MQELYQLLDQITEFSQPLNFSHKTLPLVSFSIAAHTLFLLLGERDETFAITPFLLPFALLPRPFQAPSHHIITWSAPYKRQIEARQLAVSEKTRMPEMERSKPTHFSGLNMLLWFSFVFTYHTSNFRSVPSVTWIIFVHLIQRNFLLRLFLAYTINVKFHN